MIRIRLKIYYYARIKREKSNLKSGTDKANKLPCKSDRYCTEWAPFKSVEKISSGAELRWINNDVENCPNSGVKNYFKYKIIMKTKVVADE